MNKQTSDLAVKFVNRVKTDPSLAHLFIGFLDHQLISLKEQQTQAAHDAIGDPSKRDTYISYEGSITILDAIKDEVK